MINYLYKLDSFSLTFIFSLLAFILSVVGSAFVFFVNKVSDKFNGIISYLTNGIMLSGCVFSLIIPCIYYCKVYNLSSALILSIFIFIGFTILFVTNYFLSSNLNILYVISMIIHNIPEGIIIALAFYDVNSVSKLYSSIILSFGIGIQNIPESLSIALLLRRNNSKVSSFLKSVFTSLFEFISSIIGILLITKVKFLLPSILALSSGCILYTIFCDDDIKKEKDILIFYFIIGFIIMMLLDLI